AYPSDFQNGQLPVESLIGAHTLAYTPKAPNEYRVVVLGESGIAGWGLPDSETFTTQLTTRKLSIEGKQVIAYNLAYPSPNIARDALILDAALDYQPDLVIWFVTGAAFDNSIGALGVNGEFFALNRARLQKLVDSVGLNAWLAARLDPLPAWSSWVAIHDQD